MTISDFSINTGTYEWRHISISVKARTTYMLNRGKLFIDTKCTVSYSVPYSKPILVLSYIDKFN